MTVENYHNHGLPCIIFSYRLCCSARTFRWLNSPQFLFIIYLLNMFFFFSSYNLTLPPPATLGVLLNALQPSLVTRPNNCCTVPCEFYSFRSDSNQSILPALTSFSDLTHLLEPDVFPLLVLYVIYYFLSQLFAQVFITERTTCTKWKNYHAEKP